MAFLEKIKLKFFLELSKIFLFVSYALLKSTL